MKGTTKSGRMNICQLEKVLASNYFSNRKMLKYDKEIAKAKILKYVIMNFPYAFLPQNNKVYVLLIH